MNDPTFYYSFWIEGNKGYQEKMLLLSIAMLRIRYKYNKIKIILYTEPKELLGRYQNKFNLDLIYKEPFYKSKLVSSPKINLISRHIDIFNIAKEAKEQNVIALDTDYFIINNLNIKESNKVKFLQYNTYLCNTGLVYFNPTVRNTDNFFALYDKILYLLEDLYKQDEMLFYKTILQPYGTNKDLQEEMIFSLIMQKFQEYNNFVYADISPIDHFIPGIHNIIIDKINGVHPFLVDSKEKMIQSIIGSKNIQKILTKINLDWKNIFGYDESKELYPEITKIMDSHIKM